MRSKISLEDIYQRTETVSAKAGRGFNEIELIAVSKVQPNERVHAVLQQGHRIFGENKVQAAAAKWPAFKEEFDGVKLHLIGPLQTNKVKQAIGLFDAIQTLDREKLARKIASEIQAQGKSPELFVQVNTGTEPQKSGVLPEDSDSFIATCRDMDLTISGLMVIPPVDEEAALHFALLKKIAERNGIDGLSMGMSADFEKAIAFGATHIRVGSAIFGDRVYS